VGLKRGNRDKQGFRMICEKCNEREATVHVTYVGRNDEISKWNLCERCYEVITLAKNSGGKKSIESGWTSYSPPGSD
jgi:hypothetical protein